jgi:hypothetical protein
MLELAARAAGSTTSDQRGLHDRISAQATGLARNVRPPDRFHGYVIAMLGILMLI